MRKICNHAHFQLNHARFWSRFMLRYAKVSHTSSFLCSSAREEVSYHQYLFSTVATKKMVTFPFHSVPSRRKQNGCSMHKNGNGTGQRLATGKRRKVQSTIPIVASTKKTLGESKKAKRNIALSKQSHLEVIRVNWHFKVNRLSIADFDPSRASIAEVTRNWRAAVENCSRRP